MAAYLPTSGRSSDPDFPTTVLGYQPRVSPGIAAAINGCSKLNKALIQGVGQL